MKRVILSGEGSNELGDWEDEPGYRAKDRAHPEIIVGGVVEALCRKTAPDGWKIIDAIKWDRIAKHRGYRVRGPSPEHRSVLSLALQAQELGGDTLIFVRDTDGDKERERALEAGLAEAKEKFPELSIGGGPAIEKLESWIAAMLGMAGTERVSDTRIDNFLSKHGIKIKEKDKTKLVAATEAADLTKLPADAASLRQWLERVRSALS